MRKQYYIGLDVHKLNTVYAVKDWNGETITKGKVATRYEDLSMVLKAYLKDSMIIVEASTSYYKLYRDFKDNNYDIRVANVIKIRRLIGKDDEVDAIRLADMARLNTLPESYIPDKKIQNLRNLVHLYHKLIGSSTRLKNQIHAVIDKEGLRLDSKSPFTKKWCKELQGKLASIDSIELRYSLEMQQDIEKRVENLKAEILGFVNINFSKEYYLLLSIAGIGETLAPYILADVLPINRFENKKKLRRYAGVIPITSKSDGKIYATYLPKTSSRKLLRYALVEAANLGVRKKDSNLQKYYNKKRKGRKHGQAVMCVASTLSDLVYTVLDSNKPYEEKSCSTC
jgi:transposase